MRQNSSAAALKFRAISDPLRLRILHLLLKGELCVCDLIAVLRVPQPTASRHLAYLRKAALVNADRRGLWMFYSLRPAKTAFDSRLLACVHVAPAAFPELLKDRTRLAKLKKSAGCC